MGILLVVNGNCVFNFLQWAEERKVKVFQKGERVVCGSKGVCVVEEITTLDIAGVDKKREYYILKPLYLSSSTVYIPVDTAEGAMRKVLAHEEAENLIHRIPEIPRIIKTIYLRKRAREEAGRKETAVDARYFRIAEDQLYGELAVALDMSRENVESYINTSLQSV